MFVFVPAARAGLRASLLMMTSRVQLSRMLRARSKSKPHSPRCLLSKLKGAVQKQSVQWSTGCEQHHPAGLVFIFSGIARSKKTADVGSLGAKGRWATAANSCIQEVQELRGSCGDVPCLIAPGCSCSVYVRATCRECSDVSVVRVLS